MERIACSSSCPPSLPDEIVVDLGKPTASDSQSPRIFELRQRGVKWKEIQEITGIDYGNASNFYQRYVKAMKAKSAEAAANLIEMAPDSSKGDIASTTTPEEATG